MAAERSQMGWTVPDFGATSVLVCPDERQIAEVVVAGGAKTVHVLAGARWTALGRRALSHIKRNQARLGIMSESADPRGLKGIARWLKYVVERYADGRHFNFLLAMGVLGKRWFELCQYPPSRTFAYAYFTEALRLTGPATRQTLGGSIDIGFVGSCIARKGVDILIAALAEIQDLHWSLNIVGEGHAKALLQSAASVGQMKGRVVFYPFMDNARVIRFLSGMDLSVLPSRFDGWGAVVNEALMVGVPVVCSSRCGAADLLGEVFRGEVFRAGSADALAQVLRKWIIKGKRTLAEREKIRSWSRCIEGESGARYLKGILEHVYEGKARPVAPWYSSESANVE